MKNPLSNCLKKTISLLLTTILSLSTLSEQVLAANPKISIIIPVYNTPENLLRDCLNSAKNQTLKDIEIICIDDGSTDNSGKILDEYAKNDPKFQVIHQKNSGCAVARNKGIDIAKGEYIQFLDSDDTAEPIMSKICYDEAKENNADMVKCAHNTNRGFIAIIHKKLISYPPFTDFDKSWAHVIWNGIFKTSFLKNIHLKFDEKSFSRTDTSFNVSCCLYANKIVFIPQKLYNYNQFSKPNSICDIAIKNENQHDYDRTNLYKYVLEHVSYINNKDITSNFIVWFSQFADSRTNIPEIRTMVLKLIKDDTINLLSFKNRQKLRKIIQAAKGE